MNRMPRAIEFGDLRRTTPIDSAFGLGRGRPVDRYYIEAFLERHADDIRGHVLEVTEANYTHRYGGDKVIQSDVLCAPPGNANATIVADLAHADELPGEQFDCFICTQTLTYIYPLERALHHAHRLLRPNGVLLVTVPGISQISPTDDSTWGEYWRFTRRSLTRLLQGAFGEDNVSVRSCGNVLTSIAFLHGLAMEDLSRDELDVHDEHYPLVILGRAVKSQA
ncbi:MAG TPA: methyltransferase domain-containing protein [Burkholderiaceae bacterium]|nr:methyltransferase domain-containing protein [Burkholderiaceae bacterium]